MSDNVLFSIERQFPEELAGELCEFFGHKGWPYEDCIRDFLEHGSEGEREGLEWRFYLARADGRPVSNICTWEHRGIGILGHVYTRPEWRQKGLAKRLFALQMKDFAERDGREMYLNVMPGSVAHRLYRSLGYEDIDGKPGGMVWRRGVAGSPSLPLRVSRFRWRHWPALNALMLKAGSAWVRSIGLSIYGQGSVEGPLQRALFAKEGPPPIAYVLEGDEGGVAGFASLLKDPLWGGRAELPVFDLFVPEEAREWARELAEGVLAHARQGATWYCEQSAAPLAEGLGLTRCGSVDGAIAGRPLVIYHR